MELTVKKAEPIAGESPNEKVRIKRLQVHSVIEQNQPGEITSA
jgi:hypothetical protein